MSQRALALAVAATFGALIAFVALGSDGAAQAQFYKKKEEKAPPGSVGAVAQPALDAAFASALQQPLQPLLFDWRGGQPPLVLPSLATHMCMLTGISGKLAGGGEKISLQIDRGASGGPRWVLIGHAQQPLVATVACAARAKFVPMMQHPERAHERVYPERVFSGCPPSLQLLANTPTPQHALFLSTIGGRFAGGGEALVATSQNGQGRLHGEACSGYVVGAVTSFGSSDVPAVKFRTVTSRTTNVTQATFVASETVPQAGWVDSLIGADQTARVWGEPVWLSPVDDALCGLVSIRGKFDGFGERAGISIQTRDDGRPWWRLQVESAAQGSVIAASARCIARDQR